MNMPSTVALPIHAGLGAGRELGREHVRNQRAQHDQVDDVEEISRGDQRDDFDVQRRYFRVVERRADKALDGLSHGMPSPCRPLCGQSRCFLVVIAVALPRLAPGAEARKPSATENKGARRRAPCRREERAAIAAPFIDCGPNGPPRPAIKAFKIAHRTGLSRNGIAPVRSIVVRAKAACKLSSAGFESGRYAPVACRWCRDCRGCRSIADAAPRKKQVAYAQGYPQPGPADASSPR